MMNRELEVLQEQLRSVVAQLGIKETVTDEERAHIHAQIKELSDSIISLSSQGDMPVFIINLTYKDWIISRSYSSFWIAGKKENKQYQSTRITGRAGKVDTGRGGEPTPDRGWRVKLDSLYWPAEMIAKDIVRQINGDLPGILVKRGGKVPVKTMGVFISKTAVPDTAVLKAEIGKLNLYYGSLVAEGNAVWQKTHDYKQISDLHREAVEALGLSTEWHSNITAQEFCDGCGQSIRHGIAKCPHCGAILDRDKAEELGLIPETAQGSRRGRKPVETAA